MLQAPSDITHVAHSLAFRVTQCHIISYSLQEFLVFYTVNRLVFLIADSGYEPVMSVMIFTALSQAQWYQVP